MARFSDEQIRRYSRQILLREVGGHGQQRLCAARPLLVCAGAVGEVTAEYLWRAGVTGLTLLAPTEELAAQLSGRLAAAGYPGPPAQGLGAAPPGVKRLTASAPGFTLLQLAASESEEPFAQGRESAPGTLLWAGGFGALGLVGEGTEALRDVASGATADAEGPQAAGAMIVGSALALLGLQHLLGIVDAARAAAPMGSVWRIDLEGSELPAWIPPR